jgi:hypothetical protein
MKESFLALFFQKRAACFYSDKERQFMPTAPRSSFISIWFSLDAGGPTPLIAGIPCSIIYFVLLAAFIVGSLIAAYADDEKRGAFKVSV